MTITDEKRAADYQEAKSICETYINYNGDKRSIIYKKLQRGVVEIWMYRMNFNAKALGLPTFLEYFY